MTWNVIVPMTWNVIVAKRKQLAKFPAKDQARIESALKAMAADAFSGGIIKLEGEGLAAGAGAFLSSVK